MNFEIWEIDPDYHHIYYQGDFVASIRESTAGGTWGIVGLCADFSEKNLPQDLISEGGVPYEVLLDGLYHELFIKGL